MLYPGPTGGFAELFPSPVKGHDPGLSDEQSAETQALVSAQVTQLQSQIEANAAQTTAALAGKEPTIGEGSLSQSKVTNLVASLGAKALRADLISGLAGKHGLIADGSLAQSKVTSLVSDLAAQIGRAHV